MSTASVSPPRRARTLGRRLAVAGLAAAVLAAVLLLAGGWYFSGQIRSDGLAVPRSSTADEGLRVVAAETGTVGLHEAPGRARDPVLRSAGTYGLSWPGGQGVLRGELRAGPGGSVVRGLEVRAGAAPQVGMRAALDVQVYDDPRSAYGVAYDDVAVPCSGGRCPAWHVPGPSTTWAVLVHGKGASRTEPLRALGGVLRAGLPALVISYRNDPGVPRDPSGYYRYGATEWRDLDSAVGYAVGHGARHVVLCGFSMGGGIVASFLENSARASVVSGLLLDAPMLDFRRTVDFAAAQRTLPVVGGPLPRVLTRTAETLAGWRYGISWRRIDYLDGHWLHVPTLLFHGTADLTVPIATSDRLAERDPRLVREVRTAGASHVGSWNADPAGYTATVTAFLRGLPGAA